MSRPKKKPARRPASETRTALIEALLRLLEKRSAGDLSIRDVAAEAGVNHGLVHRYFGSKEQLVREAIAVASTRAHDRAGPGLSSRSFEILRRHPLLPIIVARACLDGPRDLLPLAAPPPELIEELAGAMDGFLKKLGVPVDAHVLNALGTSALLGWFVFRPLLEHGYRLPKDADAQLARLLELLDLFLSGTPAPGSTRSS
jgi:AcrR family transcriptional regulator